MHRNRNTFNYEEWQGHYRRYISNISYRYKFKVIYEDERVLKEEKGKQSVIVDATETPRNTLSWKAWLKLKDQYGYSGIWKTD